jgi:hypothetical protein
MMTMGIQSVIIASNYWMIGRSRNLSFKNIVPKEFDKHLRFVQILKNYEKNFPHVKITKAKPFEKERSDKDR